MKVRRKSVTGVPFIRATCLFVCTGSFLTVRRAVCVAASVSNGLCAFVPGPAAVDHLLVLCTQAKDQGPRQAHFASSASA